MLQKVWDLDTPEREVTKILTGRTITLDRTMQGRPIRPTESHVEEVRSIRADDLQGGRVLVYTDADRKSRIVNFRDISDIR